MKPKQPSPSPSPLPPGEVARNKTWAGPSLETQDDDHETPSVDRKRRRAKTHRAGPALEILRSYQSQNVHAGRGRLTVSIAVCVNLWLMIRYQLKPSSRPGFLSKGKASAPLQVLSRQAAKRRSKAYLHGYDDTDGSDHLDIVHDDLAILGIRAPVPSHDEEELEQQLRRHPKKVKNMYTLSNHSDAFKQNSYNSSPDTRQSDHRDFLPTHFRTVNRRLPSTGITGSPSWPSIPKTETSTHQHQSSLLPSSQADQRQVRISDPNVKIRIGRRIYSTKDEAGPERDMRHLGTQGGHQANPTFAHSGGYNTFPIQSGASQHEMAYGQIIPRDLAPQYEADDVIYASRGNNLKQLYLTPQRPSDKVGNPRHDDPAVDGSVPSDARLRAESSFMMTPNDPPVWTVPFHSSNRSTSSRTPLNPSFGAAIQADLYLIGTSGDDQPQHASRDNVYDIGGHSHHHPGNIPLTDDWQVQNLQVLPRTPRHSDTYPHIVWDPYSHPSSDHERADLFSQPPQPSLLDREDSFREDPFQSSYHEPYQAQFLPAILENREDEENIPPSACDSATPDDAMYVDLTETAAEEVKMFGASGEEWKKLWQSRRNVL